MTEINRTLADLLTKTRKDERERTIRAIIDMLINMILNDSETDKIRITPKKNTILVREIITDHPGLETNEIVKEIKKRIPSFVKNNIHTTLYHLHKRNEIEKIEKKWYMKVSTEVGTAEKKEIVSDQPLDSIPKDIP